MLRFAILESGKNRDRLDSGMKLQIREIRLAQGMTLETLADGAGLSLSFLSEIETGKKVANTRRLESIANALSVRPADLMGGDGADSTIATLIENFCRLSPRRQGAVLDLCRALCDEPEQGRE